MAWIHVCPLSRLAGALAATGAETVVSLSTGPAPALPAVAVRHHFTFDIADIVAAEPGLVLAARHHVEALLDAVRGWNRRMPLLIHCFAGVSRSPAAAFAAVCALRPGSDEGAIARALRSASPSATPNARLVALADAVLGRGGRMVDAIAAIGRGRDCFEGEAFRLEVPDAPVQMPAHQA